MDTFTTDPWYEIIVYALAYEPTNDNNHAFNFVNNIPNRDLCRLYRKQCHAWLKQRHEKLVSCLKNKHDFLQFIVDLKNIIHIYKKQPILHLNHILLYYKLTIE